MTVDNRKQFVIHNCIVLPPNVKFVLCDAFYYLEDEVFYVYGPGVEKVENYGFQQNFRLRKVILPVVKEIGTSAFSFNNQLEVLIAP